MCCCVSVVKVIPVNQAGAPIGEIAFTRTGLLGFVGPVRTRSLTRTLGRTLTHSHTHFITHSITHSPNPLCVPLIRLRAAWCLWLGRSRGCCLWAGVGTTLMTWLPRRWRWSRSKPFTEEGGSGRTALRHVPRDECKRDQQTSICVIEYAQIRQKI